MRVQLLMVICAVNATHALSCDQTCERFVCECETNYNGTFCDQSKCLVSVRSSSLASSLLKSIERFRNLGKPFLSPGCDLARATSSPEGPYTFSLGDHGILSCQSSDSTVTITWEKNYSYLTKNPTVEFERTLLSDQGTYRCILQNNHCKQQLQFSLTVDAPTWGKKDFWLKADSQPDIHTDKQT